jgi:hypothetical protein
MGYMLFIRRFFLLFLTFSWIVTPLYANADEEVENKIYVTESDSKLNAVIEGAGNTTIRLKPKEQVLWKDASGYLGAALSSDRFYVVSTTSGAWKEFRLKPQEAEGATASLSPFIAVLATNDRAVCYNISMNSFFEIRLPVRSELVAVKAGKHVAVVATTDKLFGIRKSSSSFTDARLKVGERVSEIDVTANKVVVRTSDRLLSFVADDTEWSEYKLK